MAQSQEHAGPPPAGPGLEGEPTVLAAGEARFRKVFEYSNDAILLIDPDVDDILDANPAACRLLGYTRREITSQTIAALFPRHLARLQAFALAVVTEGDGWIDEIGCQTRTGDGLVVEVSGSEVPLEGTRTCLLLLLRDATARKAAETRIRQSLSDKEVLLRELHHRVKNNLQVVVSLFDMQAQRSTDESVLSVLRECRNRVRSMAAIHESLYRAHDLTQIDFRRYLTNLAEELLTAFGASTRVALLADMDDIDLDLEQAIPCGLIVNELVSNVLKHAFPGDATGCLRLSLRAEPEGVTLVVADDGPGLPADIDLESVPSLGLRLVHGLAMQLQAGIDVGREGGTTFTLQLPASD